MLYHHSITQKMSSEKATEEFPRVLPLKIIIQNFVLLKWLPWQPTYDKIMSECFVRQTQRNRNRAFQTKDVLKK